MQEPTHFTDSEAFRESSLNGLVELQRFLNDELEEFERSAGTLKRAFRPLTDGLGLEAPKRRDEAPAPQPAGKQPSLVDLAAPFIEKEWLDPLPPLEAPEQEMAEEEEDEPEPARPATMTATHAATLAETAAPVAALAVAAPMAADESMTLPPPMPRPTWLRRMQSALIDDVFVLTLWLGALIITANVLSGFTVGFSTQVFVLFGKPLFMRFAALEFATLWLSYFAICIGALDMTFGMWVWGIRIGYGENNDESRFSRKVSRILLSFLFFAPIAPSILLSFRKGGRSLLDSMSGTTLYRTGA